MTEDSLTGQLLSLNHRTRVHGIEVWFAYETLDGERESWTFTTGDDGRFEFPLPVVPLCEAAVGAHTHRAYSVDLEPNGQLLEPGDVNIILDDSVSNAFPFGPVGS